MRGVDLRVGSAEVASRVPLRGVSNPSCLAGPEANRATRFLVVLDIRAALLQRAQERRGSPGQRVRQVHRRQSLLPGLDRHADRRLCPRPLPAALPVQSRRHDRRRLRVGRPHGVHPSVRPHRRATQRIVTKLDTGEVVETTDTQSMRKDRNGGNKSERPAPGVMPALCRRRRLVPSWA